MSAPAAAGDDPAVAAGRRSPAAGGACLVARPGQIWRPGSCRSPSRLSTHCDAAAAAAAAGRLCKRPSRTSGRGLVSRPTAVSEMVGPGRAGPACGVLRASESHSDAFPHQSNPARPGCASSFRVKVCPSESEPSPVDAAVLRPPPQKPPPHGQRFVAGWRALGSGPQTTRVAAASESAAEDAMPQ